MRNRSAELSAVTQDADPTPRAMTPPRSAAIAGVVFAALMGCSLTIVRLAVPPYHADPGAWLTDRYRRDAVRVAIYLAPFVGIAFLWFIGVVRSRLGVLEDRFFASVFLGSGLLFVAGLYASAAFSGALVQTIIQGHTDLLHTDTYYLIRQLIAASLNIFAIKMAGVFTITTSSIVLRTGILPSWVAYSGFGCAAVLLLVITEWPWIALLFPCWILAVSLCILHAELSSRSAAGL